MRQVGFESLSAIYRNVNVGMRDDNLFRLGEGKSNPFVFSGNTLTFMKEEER
jgi:hypothetical protein